MIEQSQSTSWPELAAILLARLGFLWLLVFISLLLPGDETSFYTFMGMAFIITIPYSLWLRSKLRSMQFASLQFIVDIVLVTGLVYFTGGVRSDLTLLYPLVILSAGIVGTPRQAAEITVLAVVTYTLMAALLSNGLVTEYLPADSAARIGSTGKTVFLRGMMFVLFGVASIYVSKQCLYAGGHHDALHSTTRILLENIPCPVLLLATDGLILFANDAACNALGWDRDELGAKRFPDISAKPREPIPDLFGRTTCLKRATASALPVSYATCDFELPDTALPNGQTSKDSSAPVTLLAFHDITDALKTTRQLEKVERITAATRIAGEMAHEIRTPLTSISASIQLLRHYEDKATAADWLPNSPRRRDRKELFNHIEDASRKMDDVVQNFVDFAEFSPQDLLSIIKLDSKPENQGYIGHLNTVGRGLLNGQNSDSGR